MHNCIQKIQNLCTICIYLVTQYIKNWIILGKKTSIHHYLRDYYRHKPIRLGFECHPHKLSNM